MDLTTAAADAIDVLQRGGCIESQGAGTHSGLGFPVEGSCAALRAPSGIIRHDPDDLTVTVWAGTPVAELEAALDERGQFVPLDPRDRRATVGGTIAAGLSGVRRLGYGPIRDHVLEIRFVTGYGEIVKAGGPTVKNVTGYDLVRLLVGSLGSLGHFLTVTLRCRPSPTMSCWWVTSLAPPAALERMYRAVAVVSDGLSTCVAFEGEPSDASALGARLENATLAEPPQPPNGSWRGRISVEPGRLESFVADLEARVPVAWLAEWGVGTVHVATDTCEFAEAARDLAVRHGGWMLREAGGPMLDPFGTELPNRRLQARIRHALDPHGRCAPGRFGPGSSEELVSPGNLGAAP